jgi:putative oxidoreductase
MTNVPPTDEAASSPPDSRAANALFFAGFAAPVLVIARAMHAYIFIVEGVGKIGDYDAVVGYMQAHGVDGRLLPLVILTELVGGLCILAGLVTRGAAVALFGFCVLTAFFFHRGPDEAIQFEKNFAIAGGFLILAVFGPGHWSIDAWRRRRPDGPHSS